MPLMARVKEVEKENRRLNKMYVEMLLSNLSGKIRPQLSPAVVN